VGWILKGKELSQEEYEEYRRQEQAEQARTEEEIRRRISEVGEAFRACREFIEQHPEVHYNVKDAEAREHQLYQKLRQNLERAQTAPRCEKVREDGTVCGCPQMKGYRYCYAHERMLEMRSSRLELPPLEDANAVQMAIMRVQKALIDDEISEKKAGLLLYSLQMASSNLKHTTFTDSKKEVVTEMRESPAALGMGAATSKNQVLPLIHTDDTDRKSSNWQLANSKSESLPRINADERGSKPAVSTQRSALSRKRLPKSPRLPESLELESTTKTFTTEAAEEHRGKRKPQSRPAVEHEHRVG
jgi:hypothetical protein